jgi:hypothetical protein
MVRYEIRKEDEKTVVYRDGQEVFSSVMGHWALKYMFLKSAQESVEMEQCVSLTSYRPDGRILLAPWNPVTALKYLEGEKARLERMRAMDPTK